MAQLLLLLSAFLTFGLQITGALPEAKISGGTDVGQGDIRYQALIIEFGLYKCGGSIINRRSILTAASCVPEKNNPFAYTVIVGDVAMGNADGTEQAHVPIEIIHKEEYVPGSLENDIALLILSTSIDFNNYVNEIRIAQPGSGWYYNEPAATISGWGDGGKGSKLQRGTATVSKKDVAVSNCPVIADVDSVLCVSSGACSKDLGGPLVTTSTGETVQIGIASKINDICPASGTDFGVFTEIAPYTTWIDSKIRDVDTAGKGHVSKVNTLLMVLTASILIFFSC